MKIHKKDIGDVLEILPELEVFDNTIQSDFIICTLGFEERTHKVLDELLTYPSNHKTLILIEYPTNEQDNEDNRQFFNDAKKKLQNSYEIKYERSGFYNKFVDLLKEKGAEGRRVIFDISTCSSYLFYPIFKALIDLDLQLVITYCEASVYYPTKEQWCQVEEIAKKEKSLFVKSWDEADFLTIGVDDVYYSNLFYDMNADNKTSILVAVPNFNSIRMQSIREKDFEINKTSTDNIKWLIGTPPSEVNYWRTTALIKTNLLENAASSNIQYISTLYYKETIKALESIWESNKYTAHISIGSLGSKMQHLGTFLFLFLHQDIGLWLAEPKEFKAKTYSEGTENLFQANFGLTEQLRNKLSEYMQFEWEF